MRVLVKNLRQGMRLARSIFSADGQLLLVAGTELHDSYVRQLERLGVPSVYVQNELAPDVVPPEVVSPETRFKLTSDLQQTMVHVRQAVDVGTRMGARRWAAAATRQLQAGINQVVKELVEQREALLHLQDIRLADEYTLHHSVNVCILSAMIAITAGFHLAQVRELAMGALLHDIGKTQIPPAILNKPGKLTREEEEDVQQHTTLGYRLLREQADISAVSAHVAWEHHERWEGGGYPRGLTREQIHPYGRICCVADCYDALTSDRPYRRGFSPAGALEVMRGNMGAFFQPELFDAVTENLALYPIGSVVELNSGEIAVVTGVRRGHVDRPTVRVVQDAAGQRLASPVEVDLTTDPARQVVRMVSDDDSEVSLPDPSELA